jgi:hypothetical protein
MKKHLFKMVLSSGLLFILLAGSPLPAENEPVLILEVSGTITNEAGAGIQQAIVEAVESDVSPVLTDEKGKYKFYLVGRKTALTLRVSKEGYSQAVSKPIDPLMANGKINYDEKLATGGVAANIEMTKFVSGVSLSGIVKGITPEETKNYKVVVYILTDKWYIHPFAENKPGRGFGIINKDGSWGIDTINRGHGPFKLVMIVVPRAYMPPFQFVATENSEQDVKNTFKDKLVAMKIIPAPEGL